MMNTSHFASGTAAGAWLAVAADVSPPIGLTGAGLAGLAALTPDLDHPSAIPVKALGLPGRLLCHGLRFVSRLTTGTEHRGITHSLMWVLAIGSLTGCLARLALDGETAVYLGVSAGLGVVAALAGDLVTRASLRFLFWPFTFHIVVPQWARIRTGGPVELFLVLPGVSAATALGLAELVGVSVGVPGV